MEEPRLERLNIVAAAYACEPHRGSEPGIGWNIVRELAREHEVWVITRANNRQAIEAELSRVPEANLHPVYLDLPAWARWWKKGRRGLQLYYYLWQAAAFLQARALHRRHPFDLAHHVTFGRYWSPSFLVLLPIPFVWGPVGGGESAPAAFLNGTGLRGRSYEALRNLARWIGERDPFVRLTAHRCAEALATTEETARRLRALGVRRVRCVGNAALNRQELQQMGRVRLPPPRPIRLISIGRLLHWKGFHLGLQAFARAGLAEAEYWIVGDGPERRRLEALARALGLQHRVHFWGELPRTEVLSRLEACHVLVHPSLHDSGGWACIEAMAAGRPVLCLDLGGPALLVNDEVGCKIPARTPEQAVQQLAEAMHRLAADAPRRTAMGQHARARAATHFTWAAKTADIAAAYRSAVGSTPKAASPTAPSLSTSRRVTAPFQP